MSAPLPSLPTSFCASNGTCKSPRSKTAARSKRSVRRDSRGVLQRACRIRGTRNFATSSGSSAKQLMKNFAVFVSAPVNSNDGWLDHCT